MASERESERAISFFRTTTESAESAAVTDSQFQDEWGGGG
jgi:hypothetical protein